MKTIASKIKILMVIYVGLCVQYFILIPRVFASGIEGDDQVSSDHSDLLTDITIESEPVSFLANYIGVALNQNEPWSYGTNTNSAGGQSWGAEYRFFYKDRWTLSINGMFKKLYDLNGVDVPVFDFSEDTMRIIRLYHPWYLVLGARISYFLPVRKIAIPYERDPTRAIDTGAAAIIGTIFQINSRLIAMVTVDRWRSLSTLQFQGIEVIGGFSVGIK